MNSKGQVIFFSLMLVVVVIILSLSFAPILKTTIDSVRNESNSILMTNQSTSQQGLNCSSDSLNTFNQGTCAITDISLVYFIGVLIFIGGLIFFTKLRFG